uniref:beta-1,3-galactosyltransferase 4-like n=1 Tax=Ciona intestinalis TaxID=7719 RepID=UPI0000525092|nr:beta-1,3-galactosyltransferase 4-like [Ciona intestinalis]|eukprot:XP_002120190.1 beta-1,3-galactosyltransferase 4-like [Ciona intestinalis]
MTIWIKKKVLLYVIIWSVLVYICCIFVLPFMTRRFWHSSVRSPIVPVKYNEEDNTVEKEIAFQIQTIFKKLTKLNEVPDTQENTLIQDLERNFKFPMKSMQLPERNVEVKNISKEYRSKPILESLRKNIVIQYPTAGAPFFTGDLKIPWKISSTLLVPWKVMQNIGEVNPDNNGCFSPPDPREHWAMITMVKSWTVNAVNRQAIRETWGSITRIEGVNLEMCFLLARPKNAALQGELKKENEKYGDILQIDIEETTDHFTARSVAGMNWIVKNIPANFLFSSCDDNMVLNLDNFIMSITETVKRQKPASKACMISDVFPFICVFSFRRSDPPSRDVNNPWSITSELYPPDVLPAHCQGGFYTTSVSTIRLIIAKATVTRVMALDAVWLTGILRQKAGMDANSVNAAHAIDYPGELVRYVEKDIPSAMRKYWEGFSKKKIVNQKNVYVRLK